MIDVRDMFYNRPGLIGGLLGGWCHKPYFID